MITKVWTKVKERKEKRQQKPFTFERKQSSLLLLFFFKKEKLYGFRIWKKHFRVSKTFENLLFHFYVVKRLQEEINSDPKLKGFSLKKRLKKLWKVLAQPQIHGDKSSLLVFLNRKQNLLWAKPQPLSVLWKPQKKKRFEKQILESVLTQKRKQTF